MIDERFYKWSVILVPADAQEPVTNSFYRGNTKSLLFFNTRELAMNVASERNKMLEKTKSTSRYKVVKVHDAEAQRKHDNEINKQRPNVRKLRRIVF
jgi:hypothetical protein